jgi:hypothetical protein
MIKREKSIKDLQLHDKNIKRIESTGDKNFIIDIEDNGYIIELKFINVKHVKIDNFRLGNIILDIVVYESKYLNKFEKELRLLLDVNRDAKDSYLEEIKEKIKKGELLFVSVQSSYGAYGNILCERIETSYIKES